MIIYVHEDGSDQVELTEALNKEGVPYGAPGGDRKGAGDYQFRLVEIRANPPEVFRCPRNSSSQREIPGSGACLRAE